MSRELQPTQAALIARAEARWLDQARLRLRLVRRPRPVRPAATR
ncbi:MULTISPECIES: hypothetical protein [Nocardioides]|uniref:Uncharacterized protein n=1 Tax=Nocardioides lianchengensis TaxID=1045774 RepID=A0A1G6L3T9_9ACTN|nr:hypothetical protein [Nocardioides lianchengensis]NYG12698.1 hypothetical protein [Nocardioides lianchengensis]SDC37771.1 hypothetical protein SAMN05421872_102103 [Nocardioides lianchengensis]